MIPPVSSKPLHTISSQYPATCVAHNKPTVLRQRGYRLGIASNFDARLRRVVSGNTTISALEQIFVSSEIGYVKPDPRFFAAVQQRLGAAPEQIMLVGDDELNDIAGAAAAGWRNVLLSRDARCNLPGAIRSLRELL